MSKFTNNNDLPLGLAVAIVNDDYDYQGIPDYVSATTLLKPIRQIVLSPRVDPADKEMEDLVDLIPRFVGNAIHDSVEKAWIKNKDKNLRTLGYPESVISKVLVNPKDSELTDDCIPIYIEQRAKKKVGKWTVGGKFDLCVEGILHDIKTTSAWTWVFGNNDEDYKLQGSIYRWLHPDKITSDYIRIMFLFTDWQKSNAGINGYPESRIMYKDIPLMSIKETEKWVKERLDLIAKYENAAEEDIPLCTPEELWFNTPAHRYYKDPNKLERATKKSEDISELYEYKATKGKGQGIIISEPLIPKRCAYCAAYPECKQKDIYFND